MINSTSQFIFFLMASCYDYLNRIFEYVKRQCKSESLFPDSGMWLPPGARLHVPERTRMINTHYISHHVYVHTRETINREPFNEKREWQKRNYKTRMQQFREFNTTFLTCWAIIKYWQNSQALVMNLIKRFYCPLRQAAVVNKAIR